MRTYPHYAVWKDVFEGCWEVVRYDEPKRFTIVQTNIRTATKAHNARAEWQKREAEKNS